MKNLLSFNTEKMNSSLKFTWEHNGGGPRTIWVRLIMLDGKSNIDELDLLEWVNANDQQYEDAVFDVKYQSMRPEPIRINKNTFEVGTLYVFSRMDTLEKRGKYEFENKSIVDFTQNEIQYDLDINDSALLPGYLFVTIRLYSDAEPRLDRLHYQIGDFRYPITTLINSSRAFIAPTILVPQVSIQRLLVFYGDSQLRRHN